MEGIALRSGIPVWLSSFRIDGWFCGFFAFTLGCSTDWNGKWFCFAHILVHMHYTSVYAVHTRGHIRNFRNKMILTVAVFTLFNLIFLERVMLNQWKTLWNGCNLRCHMDEWKRAGESMQDGLLGRDRRLQSIEYTIEWREMRYL